MKSKNTSAPINQDEVQHYLKDIRKIKVMTPERERELSKLMCSNELTEFEKDKVNKELLPNSIKIKG